MRRLYGWGIALFIFFFTTPVFAEVVYQSDFKSDPDWTTDQPEYFYWDEESEALSVELHNKPPETAVPNRYFFEEIALEPNESWRIEWDVYIEEGGYAGAYLFGLYADDLLYTNRTHRSNSKLYSKSTVNSALVRTRSRNAGYRHNVLDTNRRDYGQGGSGPTFYNFDTWYQNSIIYNKASSTITFRTAERESGEVVHQLVKQLDKTLVFADDMYHLGVAFHPAGTVGARFNDPSSLTSSTKYLIDNVLVVQGVELPKDEPAPLSERLLEYEPLLYFHEEEDFYPMNLEAFVEGSGLWERGGLFADDRSIIGRGDGNDLTLTTLATTSDTSDWYISFSSDDPAMFDSTQARERYQRLVDEGRAVPAYYAHEMTDGYTDAQGKRHDFIVLQYWYFYAFNDWEDKGGFNNHEGDWESVFVYLDAETEEPKYVAFSAHHNDGLAERTNLFQYDSVRRDWSEVEKQEGQPVSYVSLGSHAMYGDLGKEGQIRVPMIFLQDRYDIVSDRGLVMRRADYFRRQYLSQKFINDYDGYWGAVTDSAGESGPIGPAYAQLYTNEAIRMNEPVKWAGIDKILEYQVSEPIDTINFPQAKVEMRFSEALEAGDVVTTDPHVETINFGFNSEEIGFIPRYYDFSTSLPNGSFSVEVVLTYTDEELAELGLYESELSIWYYNDSNDTWELVDSQIDPSLNTITFFTDHFSVYAIGSQAGPAPDITPLETGLRYGPLNSENLTQTIGVAIPNNTGRTLTGPLTLSISKDTTPDIEVLNADTEDSHAWYLTVEPEEYGRCVYSGTVDTIPSNITRSLYERVVGHYPLHCDKLKSIYSEQEHFFVNGLYSSNFSEYITVRVRYDTAPYKLSSNFQITVVGN